MEFLVAADFVDLDNLAKPVLDSLFAPEPESPNRGHLAHVTGTAFRESDKRVMELLLRKRVEADRQSHGVTISVDLAVDRHGA
jgi:hypothetical protein